MNLSMGTRLRSDSEARPFEIEAEWIRRSWDVWRPSVKLEHLAMDLTLEE